MDKWFPHTIAARHGRLLDHLRGGEVLTALELAALLNVSHRTIYRDVITLRSRGYSIIGAAGAGYMLRPKRVLWPSGANGEGD